MISSGTDAMPRTRLYRQGGRHTLRAVFWDQPAAERFDRLIEVLLVVLLAFGPLALGAVHAWSEQIVLTLAAGILGLFLVKHILLPGTPLVWTWAYVPVALFILIVFFQLLPLPPAMVAVLSPNTAQLKAELLGDLPEADQILSSMSLSFYLRATRHNLRLVLAVATVFAVVASVYRRPEPIKRLLAAIAVVGGAIAALALAQDIAGNGEIYWMVPTYDQAYSGPFVNHSHYGQFMNLSMGAALALLLVKLHEAFAGRRVGPREVREYAGSGEATAVKLLIAMIIVGATTVFVSLTRGGMVSMLIAAVFTTLVLSSRQSLRGRAWLLMVLAFGAFICVLWVGFEQVYDRLATLRQLDTAASGRWQMATDTLVAWTRFPAFGTGLGTYEVVYPMFDRGAATSLATHAENEYLQALAETGLLGLAALIAFGVLIWIRYTWSITAGSVAIHSAAYGLGFGLLAVLIHSVSDFGQHLPANAMLTATCCGLLVALSRMPGNAPPARQDSPGQLAIRPGRLVLLALAAGVFGWVLYTANEARIAEANWNQVLLAGRYLQADDWQGNKQASKYLFDHAEAAVEAEPDNIHYRHWLGVYEWLSLRPSADHNTERLAPELLPRAAQIAQNLHRARPLCPTFGATPCVAGEIEYFILGDPAGIEHIRTGYRLAPCDPTACFAAARVDAREGNTDEAFTKAGRAVRLDGGYFPGAARLLVEGLDRPDLALELAQGNAARLTHVAGLLTASQEHGGLLEQTRGRIFALLQRQAKKNDAPAGVFASLAPLYRQRGDLQTAIEQYRLAIRKDYDQVGWHYALARVLAEAGRIDEAIHEADICLRLRPDHGPAKSLMERLSLRPAVAERPAASRP